MANQTLTVTLQDLGNAHPVADAIVQVKSLQGYLVTSQATPTNGVVTFSLPEGGSYVVEADAAGYVTPPDQNVTIPTGNPIALTFNMTSLGITQPAAASRCRLYGFLDTVDSAEVIPVMISEARGGRATQLLTSNASGVNPLNRFVAAVPRTVYARAGRWEVDVFQGSMVRVYIPALNFLKVFQVPAQDLLNIADTKAWLEPTSAGMIGDTQVTSTVGGVKTG